MLRRGLDAQPKTIKVVTKRSVNFFTVLSSVVGLVVHELYH